jgi:hypothetical protein
MLSVKRDRLNKYGTYYLVCNDTSGNEMYVIRHRLNHEFETVFRTAIEEAAWKMFLDI